MYWRVDSFGSWPAIFYGARNNLLPRELLPMSVHNEERTIFPALLSDFERRLLNQLSTESGLSRSGVIRSLIVREIALRQLLPAQPPSFMDKARSDK
jgi:hypothetical protein